ncbi:hypothetical protein CYMTET_45927 [Cymbomonas tetramitiformis]|uniref:Uncharacterized protein n=1 Tax=Cymbomonas tetramitiformis TaxID=36881 RepID=A0AAE0BX77_9CHLO|nr:hypothetical protein CYMTET_45927 [Cymbomonas tetramitiformis]
MRRQELEGELRSEVAETAALKKELELTGTLKDAIQQLDRKVLAHKISSGLGAAEEAYLQRARADALQHELEVELRRAEADKTRAAMEKERAVEEVRAWRNELATCKEEVAQLKLQLHTERRDHQHLKVFLEAQQAEATSLRSHWQEAETNGARSRHAVHEMEAVVQVEAAKMRRELGIRLEESRQYYKSKIEGSTAPEPPSPAARSCLPRWQHKPLASDAADQCVEVKVATAMVEDVHDKQLSALKDQVADLEAQVAARNVVIGKLQNAHHDLRKQAMAEEMLSGRTRHVVHKTDLIKDAKGSDLNPAAGPGSSAAKAPAEPSQEIPAQKVPNLEHDAAEGSGEAELPIEDQETVATKDEVLLASPKLVDSRSAVNPWEEEYIPPPHRRGGDLAGVLAENRWIRGMLYNCIDEWNQT